MMLVLMNSQGINTICAAFARNFKLDIMSQFWGWAINGKVENVEKKK